MAAFPQSAERIEDASGAPYRVLLDGTNVVANATPAPPGEEAIEAFRRAAWLQPDEADFHFILGEALLRAGRPLEAAVAFEEASWANPSEGQYQVSLGVALWEAGRTGEAVSAFREAVRLVPRDPQAVNGLGVCLMALRQVGEGLRTLRHAAALAPTWSDLHLNLGLALRATGAEDEAVAALRRACDLRPGDVEAHVQLGATLSSLGRTAEAHSAFSTALRVAPQCLDRRPGERAAYEAASLAQLEAGLRRELGVTDPKRRFGMAPILFLLDHMPSTPRRLGTALTLLLLSLVTLATVRVARVYFVHYAFQDDVTAIARMPVRDDGEVLGRLLNAVERRGLGQVIGPRQFTIDTRRSYRRITCRYSVPIALWPGLQPSLRFDVDVERPVLIPDEEIEFH